MVLICPQERGYATDATHVRFVDTAALARSARRLGLRTGARVLVPVPPAAGKVFTYNEFVLVAERTPSLP